ncbi:MAG: NUDIX domain-containing protein [Rikenellaceae bacterium]
MNQTIFFTDKCLTFSATPIDGYDLVIDSRADTIAEISRAKVVDFFEKYNSILFLCLYPEESYAKFCREFRRLKAAGGVVTNSHGEMLMIKRNGRWDLPKGHLEYGETIEQCAVREVEEETAITNITLGEKIVETQHAYILRSEWAIKTTHWYHMSSECIYTKGQSEEGIEEVVWCTPQQIEENLLSTYPTIRCVFEAM